MNIYRQRAQNLIRALRESPDPSKFSMGSFCQPCGTPACVLGHCAARTDLQDAFLLDQSEYAFGHILHTADRSGAIGMEYCPALLAHFGITEGDAHALFSSYGCGLARTAHEAIAYIEGFIARKWPEEAPAQKLIAELNAIEAPVKELGLERV